MVVCTSVLFDLIPPHPPKFSGSSLYPLCLKLHANGPAVPLLIPCAGYLSTFHLGHVPLILRHFLVFDNNLVGTPFHWVWGLLVNPVIMFSSNGSSLWAPWFFCFCLKFYFFQISLTSLPSQFSLFWLSSLKYSRTYSYSVI